MSAPDTVFVCTRNAVRSPMAEALWNMRMGGGAVSCGVAPAGFPDGFMIAVMDELGHDLSDFECRGLDAIEDAPLQVICLSDGADAAASIFAAQWGADYQLWAFPDPGLEQGSRQMRLAAYRDVRDGIEARIKAFLTESA